MGNILTKPGSQLKQITEHDRTVLQLKLQRDRLKLYQKRLNDEVQKDHQMVRTMLQQGQKTRAVIYLRKQKYSEKILEKTDDQLFNIEQATDTIEFAQQQFKAMECLKAGTRVLSEITEDLKKIDIDQMKADLDEVADFHNEVNDLFSSPMALNPEDELEAQEELEQMMKELYVEKFATTPSSLPQTDSPQTKDKKEELLPA